MLINSWHPTYAMFRNPYAWGEFRIDLDRFSRAIKGKLRPGPSRIVLSPRVEDIALIATSGRVAVDVEAGPHNKDEPWTAKFPGLARLRCIGVGNTDWGLSQRWDTVSPAVKIAFQNLLRDPKITKVYQNGIWYDMPLLRRYGLPTVNFDDTRDARRATSSTSRLGLKYMATIFDDPIPWAEEDEEDDDKLVFTDNWHDLMTYNVYDCVETARVDKGIQKEEDWKTERVQRLYQTHLATSQLAADMRHRGMWIDKKERQRLADLLEAAYDEKEKKVLALVGIPGFKSSPPHMRQLLFKRHETEAIHRFSLEDPYDPKMYTPDGETIKVDQGALLNIYVDPGCPKDLRPIIEAYWDAESVWKARSTFVTSSLIDRAIGYDGYLRPDWNSCGADTGRWSCRNPNVMTIPKESGDIPNLRRMYAAPPGHILIEADYKQQELYAMWLIANDDALGEGLAGDVYTEDAKAIFKLPARITKCTCKGEHCTQPYDPKTSPNGSHIKSKPRKAAKIGHLGFQYGAGTKALYMQMLESDHSMSYSLVELVHHGLKERYHRTVSYWEEEMERVRQTGYSETRILHRRRYYPREPPITEVANYPIQGTAADVTTLAILDIDRRLKIHKPKGPTGLWGQFHDAVILCVPDNSKWIKIGKEAVLEGMEQEHTINGRKHRFRVDMKIGYNWADMKDAH